MVAAGSCAGLVWFTTLPTETFSGVPIDLDHLSLLPLQPVSFHQYQIHAFLVLTDNGLIAFKGLCPFLAQPIRWVSVNRRFECRHCGGKFRLDGTVIEGAAQRNLDRYRLQITTDTGIIRTTLYDGNPIDLHGAVELLISADNVMLSAPR